MLVHTEVGMMAVWLLDWRFRPPSSLQIKFEVAVTTDVQDTFHDQAVSLMMKCDQFKTKILLWTKPDKDLRKR